MEYVINDFGGDEGEIDSILQAHLEDIISTYELYAMPDGQVVRTHGVSQCGNYPDGEWQRCTLHNPSEHHMRDWPINFRYDKYSLIERICEHGSGHPDPDSLAFFERRGIGGLEMHTCDDCCVSPETWAELEADGEN